MPDGASPRYLQAPPPGGGGGATALLTDLVFPEPLMPSPLRAGRGACTGLHAATLPQTQRKDGWF